MPTLAVDDHLTRRRPPEEATRGRGDTSGLLSSPVKRRSKKAKARLVMPPTRRSRGPSAYRGLH